MRRDPIPGDSYLDSRDVIRYLREQEDELEQLEEEFEETEAGGELSDFLEGSGFDMEALEELREFVEDGEYNIADWLHGETLIEDSAFVDWAKQLAEDIGAIDPNAGWPLQHIDWAAAAEALQGDYSEIIWGGCRYWGRA